MIPYKWKLVVPADLRPVILKKFHDVVLALHGGFKKTIARVRARYTWPGLSKITSGNVSFVTPKKS